MKANENFYILEYASYPGIYYIDNQFGMTDDVLLAEHYSSPEEALKYMTDPSKWRVCLIHIDIQRI